MSTLILKEFAIMATTREPQEAGDTQAGARLDRATPRRFRWTREEYYRLAELGFFRNRKVELIGGEIVEMSAFKPPHAIAIELLTLVLPAAFGPGFRVRIQLPLDVGRRTLPEPDAAVLAGDPRESQEHPSTALLVIEVSDTTLRYDRGVKAHYYAKAGIADYWILNLVDRTLEIRRRPGPDPAHPIRFRYADLLVIPSSGEAAPLASPGTRISVASVLP